MSTKNSKNSDLNYNIAVIDDVKKSLSNANSKYIKSGDYEDNTTRIINILNSLAQKSRTYDSCFGSYDLEGFATKIKGFAKDFLIDFNKVTRAIEVAQDALKTGTGNSVDILNGFMINSCINTDELKPKPQSKKKKSNDTIAKEIVTKGNWGDGQERIDKLKKAGYSDKEIAKIQSLVNKMVYGSSTKSKVSKGTTVSVGATTIGVGAAASSISKSKTSKKGTYSGVVEKITEIKSTTSNISKTSEKELLNQKQKLDSKEKTLSKKEEELKNLDKMVFVKEKENKSLAEQLAVKEKELKVKEQELAKQAEDLKNRENALNDNNNNTPKQDTNQEPTNVPNKTESTNVPNNSKSEVVPVNNTPQNNTSPSDSVVVEQAPSSNPTDVTPTVTPDVTPTTPPDVEVPTTPTDPGKDLFDTPTETPSPTLPDTPSTPDTGSGSKGFNPVPLAVGLGAAVAAGVGAKVYKDHKDNSNFDDTNEDSFTNGNRFWSDEDPNVVHSEEHELSSEDLLKEQASSPSYTAMVNENNANADTWTIDDDSNNAANNQTLDLFNQG